MVVEPQRGLLHRRAAAHVEHQCPLAVAADGRPVCGHDALASPPPVVEVVGQRRDQVQQRKGTVEVQRGALNAGKPFLNPA